MAQVILVMILAVLPPVEKGIEVYMSEIRLRVNSRKVSRVCNCTESVLRTVPPIGKPISKLKAEKSEIDNPTKSPTIM